MAVIGALGLTGNESRRQGLIQLAALAAVLGDSANISIMSFAGPRISRDNVMMNVGSGGDGWHSSN